jgi:hypothetical protein
VNYIRLADLDELALAVRDNLSRSHIMEAVAAYRGGAYRAAIVATWIAVTYDIIAKIRELAGQDDANALRFIGGLQTAIASRNIQQLQRIEADLLTKAKPRFRRLPAVNRRPSASIGDSPSRAGN